MTSTQPVPAVAGASPHAGRRLLVALGSAVASFGLAASALQFGGRIQAAEQLLVWVFILMVLGGTWLAIIDARTHRLPDRILFPFTAIIAGALIAIAIYTGQPILLLWSALGAAALALFYFVLGLSGAVGLGDVKLAIVLGLFLSWYAPPALLTATMLSYALAMPHALILLVQGRRTGTRRNIPFGPYMIAGTLLVGAWYTFT